MESAKRYISLWNGYDPAYKQYETAYPHSFPWNMESREDVPRYIPGEDGYWYDPSAKPTKVALLSCTGDLMCEPRQHKAYRYGDSYFFHPTFQFVRNILKTSDFSVANLETTLSDATPYAGAYHRVARKYHCNGPECYLDAIRYAGFDALVNANNHNCDSGIIGLEDTLQAMDRHGFMRTGTFLPEDKERVLLVKINGIRVAFLSYSCKYNKLDENFTPLGIETYLNPYSKERVTRDVAYAREKGAQYVICYIHWGKDYDLVPNEQQLTCAPELAETGVDYIIGSHTHCLQHFTSITSSSGKVIPLMYSLGNFATNEMKELCKHTGILQLLLKEENGHITVTEQFIPCYVFDELGSGRFAPVPVDSMLNGGYHLEKLDDAREYVRNRIGTDLPERPSAAATLGQVCQAMGLPIPEGKEARQAVTGFHTDAYATTAHSIYFSVGPQTPGVCNELRKRSLAAIVTTEPLEGLPCLVTEDVESAYIAACRLLRRRNPAKTIAVAGLGGKTLTRHLICHMLSHLGHVLTHEDEPFMDTAVWRSLFPHHRYCVQELRQAPGVSLAARAQGLSPDICVVTGQTEDLQALCDATADGGLLLFNQEDALLCEAVSALSAEHTDRIRIQGYRCAGENTLPLPSQAPCAAAAIAVAQEEGISDAQSMLYSFPYQSYTQNILRHEDLNLVLNTSCKTAAEALDTLEVFRNQQGRRIAVLGDSTVCSEAEGRAIAAAAAGADYVVSCGNLISAALTPAENVICTEPGTPLEEQVLHLLQSGDTVLLCGGRAFDFNTTLRRLFGLTDGIIQNVW